MSRIQEIVKQKKDIPLFPGVISVFQYPHDVPVSIAVPQTRAIFDGQHRCMAIHAILQGVDAKRMSYSHQVCPITFICFHCCLCAVLATLSLLLLYCNHVRVTCECVTATNEDECQRLPDHG
jgi:hypothetical protein